VKMGDKVLVTGGTGFLGANLVEQLNLRSIEPLVLQRPTSSTRALAGLNYQPVIGDILDSHESLVSAMEGCRWVFHVGAVSDYWRSDRQQLYEVNVQGTRHVAEAALAAGVGRVVFTSSLAALGVRDDGRLTREDDTFNLEPSRFPYGHSKHLAQREFLEVCAKGLSGVIVNPSVILGPRDVNMISGSIITETARGRAIVSLPGGANYVDVTDAAAAHVVAAEKGVDGEMYILAGENLSHTEALSTVCRLLGRRPPSYTVPVGLLPAAAVAISVARAIFGNRIPMDASQVRLAGKNLFADNSKARADLGLGTTPFTETVERTIGWYRSTGYL